MNSFVNNCEVEIELVRQQLIRAAQQNGMHAEETIELSRQLDSLINEYDKKKEKNKLGNL